MRRVAVWSLFVLGGGLVYYGLFIKSNFHSYNSVGRKWLDSRSICVEFEHGYVYTTGMPITAHRAVHFLPKYKFYARLEPDWGNDILKIRREPSCSGVEPKQLPAAFVGSEIYEQWEIQGIGVYRMKRATKPSGMATLIIPEEGSVDLPAFNDFTPLVHYVLPQSNAFVAWNINHSDNEHGQLIFYHTKMRKELRFDLNWSLMDRMVIDQATIIQADNVRLWAPRTTSFSTD